jgi:hypothetical protein
VRQVLFSAPDEPPTAPTCAPVRQRLAKERPPAILVRRQGAALVGYADMDVELITRLDASAEIQIAVTNHRNVARHRLYWAVLTIVAQNLPMPMRPERLHGAVKLMLGVSVLVSLPGQDFIIPGSIAFDSMGEPEFRDFLDRFLDLIGERLLPGVDLAALESEGRRHALTPDAAPRRSTPSRTGRSQRKTAL